jgi:hypothetical protein
MPGLVPGIHVFDFAHAPKDVDAQELVIEFRSSIYLRKSGKPDLR